MASEVDYFIREIKCDEHSIVAFYDDEVYGTGIGYSSGGRIRMATNVSLVEQFSFAVHLLRENGTMWAAKDIDSHYDQLRSWILEKEAASS